MNKDYSREEDLARQFNDFWNGAFGTKAKDYYSGLSGDSWLELKKAVQDINNIITLKATCAFVELLGKNGILNRTEKEAVLKEIDSQSANANGYDIKIETKRLRLVGEVKCNIPVKKDRYGAAQIAGIEKDIEGLVEGKAKGGLKTSKLKEYLKFMVIMSSEGNPQKKAMEPISRKYPVLEEYSGQQLGKLSTDKVYVAYITI